jgi:hypothetical protein
MRPEVNCRFSINFRGKTGGIFGGPQRGRPLTENDGAHMRAKYFLVLSRHFRDGIW